MEERWSTEQILALAPDAAGRAAAGQAGVVERWGAVGVGAGLLWGEHRGSGGSPYRTVVRLAGPGFRCSCPSRRLPCKHALGLLLLWRAQPAAVPASAEPPAWALADPPDDAGDALADDHTTADDEAARRRVVQRAERRAARVAAGARELRLRLADRVRRGLAEPGTDGAELAARMVDAQAPGLAARVRELAALPSEEQLAGHALLDLLAAGYLRLAELPGPLADTVRTRVGFTVDRAELLAGPTVRDRWLVLGSREGSDGPLTTHRVWLLGATTGRTALLLSFDRPDRFDRPDQQPEPRLPVGGSVDAELAFHPGALPLRAVLGPRYPASAPTPAPGTPPQQPPGAPTGLGTREAAAAYGEAVAADPWTEAWPVLLAAVVPVPTTDGWLLTDGAGALPLIPPRPAGAARTAGADAAPWRLAAVAQGRPVTVFGECGHRGFTPVTVWDELGRPTDLTRQEAA
ncbi:SWIM zinc finger family protein [Kitasatospora sp. LaBMicrA B282]|uniref:SWIM zinc finger family protein n=1 Tax=Kitasatospora sp. LaBMicrA B282 TaxID=3420949 RepID=UPI003D145760